MAVFCIGLSTAVLSFPASGQSPDNQSLEKMMRDHIQRVDTHADELKVPEFAQGRDWFNSPPLRFDRELKGKIVVLDFWTYCCINCIHILPDLAELERKYAGFPVAFVGVHSAKFENEKVSENIRNAVLRYEIEHPVINDDEMAMWRAVGVRAWPSLAVVGPKGNMLLMVSGEGKKDVIDACIKAALDFYPPEVFRYEPLPIDLEKDRDLSGQKPGALRFPAKLAVDSHNNRLFISDSNHNRIVVTDLEGNFISSIGSGRIGLVDGAFSEAQFNRPQGLDWHNGKLYVADAENHALRVVDMETETVTTLAGNGTQGRDYQGGGSGPDQLLSTPWDVLGVDDSVYVAMAGTHQIWVWDIEKQSIANFSGDGSEQNLNSDDPARVAWAQPSGLTAAGSTLYIADSESSTIRALDLESRKATPVVGGQSDEPRNLFDFGDKDGMGDDAALQHPLGVLHLPGSGEVLVADTYNHKIRKVNPQGRTLISITGGTSAGYRDGDFGEAQFSEPSGFALHPDGKLVYVADTNNHRIRIMNLESEKVSTLILKGVPEALEPYEPGTIALTGFSDVAGESEPVEFNFDPSPGAGKELSIRFKVRLPEGYKLNQLSQSRWKVRVASGPLAVPVEDIEPNEGGIPYDSQEFTLTIPVSVLVDEDFKPTSSFVVEGIAYFCEDQQGLCRVGHFEQTISLNPVEYPQTPTRMPWVVELPVNDMAEKIHSPFETVQQP